MIILGSHGNDTEGCLLAVAWRLYSYMRKVDDGSVCWRCTRSWSCHFPGSVMTGPDDAVMMVNNTHSHLADQAEVEAKKVVTSLKRLPAFDHCLSYIKRQYIIALLPLIMPSKLQLSYLLSQCSSVLTKEKAYSKVATVL